jgi:glycosyltransferase involved in cell wall biosynthesis
VNDKNIVWIIDGLGMGGAEKLTVPFIQNLAEEGFDLRVCVLQERHGNPYAAAIAKIGVPVDLVPVKKLRDLTAIPRLVRYLRSHKAALVHTQLEFSNTLGNIAAKLLRLPSLCTLHTIENFDRGSKARLRTRVMLWSLRNFCDKVITVSGELRRHHLASGRPAPETVMTLYNGILDAAPEARYLVAGDGDHRNALENMTKQLRISKHVIFAGYREDIHDLMSISDVFVLPTLREALPTVLAEAMSAGLPIIASAVGGVPEMVTDQINGILVPPRDTEKLADACIRLLSSKADARRMGEQGRTIAAEKFDIQKQARKLGLVYRQLLESRA